MQTPAESLLYEPTTGPKTCKSCWNCLKDGAPIYWKCTAIDTFSLVTGSLSFERCAEGRLEGSKCGPEGKLWVSRCEREAEINDPGAAIRSNENE